MSRDAPDVSVVIATRDRAARLAAALESLRAQPLEAERFEVVVVDDGSTDGTPGLLAAAAGRGGPAVRHLRRESGGGPAAARNDGWRAATGALIAFMDDDCVADPTWLEAGLTAWGGDPQRFVQGPTTPLEDELDRMGPYSYTIDIRELWPEFPTCNMFYPRALLERLDGFDVAAFPFQGEDVDLAWRAQATGARPVFEPRASVRHAVVPLGPVRFLRRNWSWGNTMLLFKRHPEFRRRRLFYRVFWNWSHYLLVRLWIALALPRWRALWPLKWWLGAPYVRYRLPHPSHQLRSVTAVAWFTVVDTVEIAGCLRGSLRAGTFVL